MKPFDFRELFILDIANNHQGELDHGLKIIDAMGDVVNRLGVRCAVKFQFRQLDTLVHPDYRSRKDIPHVERFFSTRLTSNDYIELIEAVRKWKMISMYTPFDEESVDVIQNLDIDVLKIASCSATDLPLLERAAAAGLPTVASTGGASIDDIDRMVQIFENHSLNFALHHCVSIYPTPRNELKLNHIEQLLRRYSPIEIGWSTHEDPNDDITIQLAYAKGATFFERHVGLEAEGIKLNKYSSNPSQIEKWINGYKRAVESCGGAHDRSPPPVEETESLRSLMRGVYAKKPIAIGEIIVRDDVYFAMPLLDGGLSCGEWTDEITADRDLSKNQALPVELSDKEKTVVEIVNSIMLQVRGMLRDARIHLGKTSKIEISHHYGIRQFRQFGAVIIDVINREYCKKIIIQLPRQKHPYHFHRKKEETFQILYGDLEVQKNGNNFRLFPGDMFLVEPGCWHKFSTLDGVVFEEISTTHYNDDSYYHDSKISRKPRESRKTIVPNWEL